MKKQLGLLLGFLFWANIAAAAFPVFTVQDIKLEGIQHVKPGIVFHHFPIETGNVINQQVLSAAVKKLYQSGYFQNIEVEREGDVLTLKLTERPAVSKIRLSGNKVIKTEALLEGLEQAGLKEGVVFKRSSIERIKAELQTVYASQGRYNATIDMEVIPLSSNRVAVNVEIKEGKVALISHINIVGNSVFEDEELTELFSSKLASFWSWFSKDDRYSRERLSGDVERLRSYYLDRGYLNFKITSSQVSISPDKQNVFISINIFEGAKFNFGEIRYKGELVVPETDLRQVLTIADGDTFSRQRLSDSKEKMLTVLGNSGYMFARVISVPSANVADAVVDIEFVLRPGKRTYVRRINIKGNEKTADIVIRQQFVQMEAALASSENITKSKEALDRSGYFSTVDISTVPVPGTDDQIDVNLTVEELGSGNFTAGVGFSESEKLILEFGVSQDNFLGSGNRVSAKFSTSDIRKELSFDYVNPYYTVDGVSRGFDLYFREEDFDNDSSSNYKIDELGLGVTFGYPIDEYQRISIRLGVEKLDITPNPLGSSGEIEYYLNNNGNQFTNFNTTVYWNENRLNRGIFPSRGRKQNISLELSAPGSDLSYYRLSYDGSWIKPLSEDEKWLFGARANVAYADSLGDKEYPFFKNYFAGGIGSMRGVSANSLGPQDTLNDSIGGNARVFGGVDLIFPMPGLNDVQKYRTSLFMDVGGVFATECLKVDTSVHTSSCESGIDFDQLKYSVGLGFTWLTPLGPLTFSYATLLNEEDGDDPKRLDFTLGGTF